MTRFFALFLCVLFLNVEVASGSEGLGQPASAYPGELLPSVARFVASKVSVTGSSVHDDDRSDGSLGFVSESLGSSQQRIGVNYRDSVSRRESLDSSSLVLNYGFSVSKFDFGMEFEKFQSDGVAVGDGNRFDAESEHSAYKLDGSRALLSWHGFSVNSLVSHSAGSSSAANATGWAEDAQYQISKLGVEVREDHELVAGFRSAASVRAFSGVETREAAGSVGHRQTDDQFQKVAVSASLSRDVQNWTLGVRGQYQFAGDDVPSSEWVQVAGSSLAMGFNGQARYAAEGGWLRLQAGSPKFQMPVSPGLNASVEMSLLRGWTPGVASEGQQEGGASVGELSLKLDSRDFDAAFNVGKMLAVSDPELALPSRPDVSLSISVDM